MKRRCACGTILSRYNTSEECWPCDERRRRQAQPPIQTGKPQRTSTGNPSGLCKCGCGGRTPIAKRTRHVENILVGVPTHFLPGHGLNGKDRTNGNAKLTVEQVLRMRREYAAGDTSYHKIAVKYGVGEQTARQAIKGETWAHLEDAA